MRLPGGQFFKHLSTRVPWAIAIVAVVLAASTGTYWATTRIQSLDDDLSAAGETTNNLRRRASALQSVNENLRERLVDMQQALADVSTSRRDLVRRYRDVRNCVSRSNPDGGPVVSLIPNHGPIGTRVEMAGYCFRGAHWQRKDRDPLYTTWLSGPGVTCRNVMARANSTIRIRPDGRMRGSFVVPGEGRCRHQDTANGVAHEQFDLIVGCRQCTVAEFRVTTEEAERDRLEDCDHDDYRWSLEGPDGATGAIVLGVRVDPLPGRECKVTEVLSLMLLDAAGNPLSVKGNPGSATFDGALGRQRVGAAWVWRNWCQTDSYVVRVSLGAATRTSGLQTSVPRCDAKNFASRLRPIDMWMHGVSTFTR